MIIENTFSVDTISFTMSSYNVTGNGQVVPSVIEHAAVFKSDFNLGVGNFSGIFEEEVHRYELRFYFLEKSVNQINELNKEFKAYINIGEYIDPCLDGTCIGDKILNEYGGESTIPEASLFTFNEISLENENKMYRMEDDYGTSYYYRGGKNVVKNNLIFAEMQWKILRINGDGTIRIIYNGTCPSNVCTINSTGESTQISSVTFAHRLDDNKHLGYMFGGAAGTASTSRVGATGYDTSSNAKNTIDNWYISKIKGTSYEDLVADSLFCNDRQLLVEATGGTGSGGYGTVNTQYASIHRLVDNKAPTLKCARQEDRFTVLDDEVGNAKLIYPAGMITADEAVLSGLKFNTANTSAFLYNARDTWTLTPYNYSGYASSWYIDSNCYFTSRDVMYANGIRPVINLVTGINISGSGSVNDPFKIQS